MRYTIDTGRPAFLTLLDIGRKDAYSVAPTHSAEDLQPHILVAFTATSHVAAHGPFRGSDAAAQRAPHLAMHDATIAATIPVTVHDPATTTIADDRWLTIPPHIARAAQAGGMNAPAAALVLLDRERAQLAVVGPFTRHSDAHVWQPAPDGWPYVDRLVVALHPYT